MAHQTIVYGIDPQHAAGPNALLVTGTSAGVALGVRVAQWERYE